MADRPKSITTPDTDVSLDFLTKEAKEALLSKKLDMIRQRNKALTERHQLIEADRRKAEESGQAVKLAVDSQLFPAEGAVKSKGRGRGQTNHKEASKEGKERPKSSGDFRDSSNYEPIVDTSDLANYRHDHKGRGRGQHYFDGQSPAPKNKRKPPAKEEDFGRLFEYEPIVDIRDLDKRFRLVSESPRHTHPKYGYMRSDRDTRTEGGTRQRGEGKPYRGGPRPAKGDRRPYSREDAGNDGETGMTQTDNDGCADDSLENSRTYKGRLKDTDGPPPDPSFNPLADRRRSDKKEEPAEHRRHPRNYGGAADLNRVKQTMKNMREKEKERPSVNKPLEIVMTGKERRNHEEWKAEREKYDQERIMRSMNSGGNWKRAWDVDKINQESEDTSGYRQEPGKRPAGRIGSGRFDRGERDERPRSAIIGKGGIQLSDHVPASQPQRPQHHQDPVPGGDGKSPRSWGRGRGRGRGHANGPGGEKSPRPRTWSGGEERFVECQKELLLVKFDNTAGDNSVEVEYDDDDLHSSPPPPPALAKPASHTPTMPGRGPTGRTPNQSAKQHQQPRSGKPYKGKEAPKPKDTSQSNGHHSEQVIAGVPQVKEEPEVPLPNTSEEATRVRTSSHSQSFADSEEWEDCTESSGAQEDTDLAAESSDKDLHLECRLNPEAPEFLPTSPDFMKTPPGHVKVLNWASDAGPTSPSSQPSPSLRPLANSSSPSAKSPCLSPPKAVQEEEEDVMPETDEPFVLAPDSEKVLPDCEQILPDSEKVLPDSKKALPDSEKVLPDSEKILPDSEKVLSDNEKVLPDSEKVLPDSKKVLPDDEKVLHDGKKVLPDSETHSPDSEKFLPDSEKALPDSEEVLPDSEKALPDSEKVLPDSEKVSPDHYEEDQFEDSLESAPDCKRIEEGEKLNPASIEIETVDLKLQETTCKLEANQLTSTEELLHSPGSQAGGDPLVNQPSGEGEAAESTDSDPRAPSGVAPGPGDSALPIESLGSDSRTKPDVRPGPDCDGSSPGPDTEEAISGTSESINSTPEISAMPIAETESSSS